MFRKKWVEILVTDDRTAFFAAKNALEAKNIPYRTDVTDNNLRVSMNTLGAGPGRDGFVKTYYKILVEEKYAPAADILRTGADVSSLSAIASMRSLSASAASKDNSLSTPSLSSCST